MKFGISLRWGDFHETIGFPTLIEVARLAKELEYHSLWTPDIVTARGASTFSHEPLVTMASLMHLVPELQIGVSVLVLPQRNAVVLAKQAATLSLLSNGRFILGVGAGWNGDEFNLLGADYTTRGRKMDESIEVLKLLWRDKEVSFKGEFYSFEDVTLIPQPHEVHVPMWIGGGSHAAIQRAARVGDAWVPAGISPQALQQGSRELQKLSTERERPTVAAMLFVQVQTTENPNEKIEAHIGGSVESMTATLRAYEEAGLEHLICIFKTGNLSNLTSQMQIAEVVMPHFAD